MSAGAPLVMLEEEGRPLLVRYDLPAPSTYCWTVLYELAYLMRDWYLKEYRGLEKNPLDSIRASLVESLGKNTKATADSVRAAMTYIMPFADLQDSKVSSKAKSSERSSSVRPAKAVAAAPLPPVPLAVGLEAQALASSAMPSKPLEIDTIAKQLIAGKVSVRMPTLSGGFEDRLMMLPTFRPRFFIVERFCTRTYPARFGAGRVANVFSLLPGERAVIKMRNWKSDETTRRSAETVFDSHSTSTEDSYGSSMLSEFRESESLDWALRVHSEASAGVNLGIVSFGGSVGIDSRMSVHHDEFSRRLHTATCNHINRASSRRDVFVSMSHEQHSERGEENVFERTLQNTNTSRVLNFVARQMNQEYISVLHLTGIRIGMLLPVLQWNVVRPVYREFSLGQLNDALRAHFVEKQVPSVRETVIHELQNIVDLNGDRIDFIEAVPVDADWSKAVRPITLKEYRSLKAAGHDKYNLRTVDRCFYPAKPATEWWTLEHFLGLVHGPVISARRYVLRTDNVMIEAVLGRGEALDCHGTVLQEQLARTRTLENDMLEEEVAKMRLAREIVENKESSLAVIFEKVYDSPHDDD